VPWLPLPGPQTMAYESKADIVGFGGAAGGGKTDLACGKAMTKHQKAMVLRRVGTELTGIEDRLESCSAPSDGYNGQEKIWRTKRYDGNAANRVRRLPNLGRRARLSGPAARHAGVRRGGQLPRGAGPLPARLAADRPIPGRLPGAALLQPADLGRGPVDHRLLRPVARHQAPALPAEAGRAALCGDDALDGRWQLAPTYGSTARACSTAARSCWSTSESPTSSTPPTSKATEIITPRSRTFIPSRITDNPHLFGTGYMAQLQALPEPLRSQMLLGDFHAGMEDDPWQVIPTAWVEAAMARWKPQPHARWIRWAWTWRAAARTTRHRQAATATGSTRLVAYPAPRRPTGPTVAGLIIAQLRDRAPIHIDVIGVGAAPTTSSTEAPAGDRRQRRREGHRHRQVGAAVGSSTSAQSCGGSFASGSTRRTTPARSCRPTSGCWPSCARRSGSSRADHRGREPRADHRAHRPLARPAPRPTSSR
jgi:hypothetical protein